MKKKYPFKFLDSYNKDDRGIFFGRDEEINSLYEMVFQSPIMLVYGASGTGKTSLINCGLAGKFQSHDWQDLMIRRGNNINDSLEKILADAGGNNPIAEDTVWNDEWSNETPVNILALSPVAKSIKAIYQKSFRPLYLIFDQFEELFIIGSVAEQKTFIKTIQDILQSGQPVKMIFSIREEYLGYLFDFERAVPQLMRKKLRIEPMNLEKVSQVIIGATQYQDSNVTIKQGEAELVAETIFEKIKGKGKSLTIQLPFLQVFLDKFYLKITADESREATAEFNMQSLKEMGEIGDVLIDFLEEQVNGISKKLIVKYPTLNAALIWKILSPFSTLEGTKEPISKQSLYERLPGQDKVMINETVDSFVNSRILRYNETNDMFEIAHDALAKPIAEKRSIEETALLEIKRLIKSQVSVKDEAREYFTEKQLLFIEPYLDKFKPSSEEINWIAKSREQVKQLKETAVKKQLEEANKQRKTKVLTYGLIFLLLIISGGIYAIVAFDKQNKELNSALNKAQQALELEAQNKVLSKKASTDSVEIRNKSFASYGISQDKINSLSPAELEKITEINNQINMLKNSIDTTITIQYFPKLDDEDKAFLSLKDLGYSLVITTAQKNMSQNETNCIWIGTDVNNKIENVKMVAFYLLRAGIKLKAIKLFDFPDKPDKLKLIQVGASVKSMENKDITIDDIKNLKRLERNNTPR